MTQNQGNGGQKAEILVKTVDNANVAQRGFRLAVLYGLGGGEHRGIEMCKGRAVVALVREN